MLVIVGRMGALGNTTRPTGLLDLLRVNGQSLLVDKQTLKVSAHAH